ncbi:MAG: DUF4479 domain-containing protein [Thomasclavelia sp.]|nr:DUF4479 domain-containing protein [Thomasclavelia sp.]
MSKILLHGFYNKPNIGDILLIRLGEGSTDSYDKNGDLVTLYNDKHQIIGYNVLNASNYFNNLVNGLVTIDESFLSDLNSIIKEKINLEDLDMDKKFIVGHVDSMKVHPDSDHMHICDINIGKENNLNIVCGAPNIEEGQKVVVATVGAVMPSGLIIKPSKLRGVDSAGMICSARELNLPNAPLKRGILVLDDKYKIGDSFF